jgi:plastocyanin
MIPLLSGSEPLCEQSILFYHNRPHANQQQLARFVRLAAATSKPGDMSGILRAYILYRHDVTKRFGGMILNKVFIIYRKHVVIAAIAAMLVVGAVIYMTMEKSISATGPEGSVRTIHLVTGEFKTKMPDGTEIEAYRWDPGTIHVEKGETVHLSILGVNGESHPFFIEGLNVKGEVKKGKETVVTFTPHKEGTYRLICLMHPDAKHHGPMIGYIVVD